MLSADPKETKPRACIMPQCAGERFNLVHKFPRENDRTHEWLAAVDLPHLLSVPLHKLRSSFFICSRHFRKTDYKNALSRHLNMTVTPSMNLKRLDQMDAVFDTCVRRVTPTRQQVELKEDVEVKEDDVEAEDTQLSARKYRKTNTGHRADNSHTYHIVRSATDKLENSGAFDATVQDFMVVPRDQEDDVNINRDYASVEEFTLKNIIVEVDSGATEEREEVEEAPDSSHEDVVLYEDASKLDEDVEMMAASEAPGNELVEEEGEEVLHHSPSPKEYEMSANLLEINHPHYSKKFHLDYIWLRDHCRCADCYNTETHQRKFDILDIPLDIKALQTEIRENLLWIKWSDEHESEYELDFLYKTQVDPTTVESPHETVLWDQETVHQLDYSRVNFNTLLTDDEVAKSVVKSLVEFGFAFIEKVPPNANMTEAAIRRIFPIQKTFFGEMWSFSDEKVHSDTAYTNGFLGSHTDNTYWNNAAGLQVFHCIKHSGSGGETVLVDGFKVLNDLQVKNPKAYQRISTVSVPAEYIENGTHFKYSAPLVRLDPITQRPQQIRYNVYDRAVFNSLPQSEMYAFYRDFRSLAEEVNHEDNQWRFKLNPGTVLIFDNWRVLHGREKYTGKRQMTGCYVARDEYLNVARVMGLTS